MHSNITKLSTITLSLLLGTTLCAMKDQRTYVVTTTLEKLQEQGDTLNKLLDQEEHIHSDFVHLALRFNDPKIIRYGHFRRAHLEEQRREERTCALVSTTVCVGMLAAVIKLLYSYVL